MKAVVVGFDLRESDFPLKAEFPVFLSHALRFLGDGALLAENLYTAGDTVAFHPQAGLDAEKLWAPTEKAGLYTVGPGEGEPYVVRFATESESDGRIEAESANNDRIHINIALNYGGRDEIVRAVRTLAQRCAEGTISPSEISEQMVSDCLYTCGQPDPDMILRPSGEMRTSNFLPWQSTYAELVFMDVLWPDFTPNHLDQAILQYLQRSRRFGGV